MEKIINLLINNWTKGVDTYTHNGSTWLIFSESKQWVIELTESKTLWYNYNFFKELFSLTSMDVVDNQHYITKWVEDNLINKVKDTILERNITEGEVDDIIQDGVKKTSSNVMMFQSMKVEDTIQNGVKETITSEKRSRLTAENIIENGVRHTEIGWHQCNNIDDAIEKGVKEIYEYKGFRGDVKDVIQDGVKETNHVDVMGFFDNKMEDTLQNGVKETMFNRGHKQLTVKNIIENGVRHTLNTEYMPTSMVEDIIQSGVKEIKGHGFEQQNIIDDIVENGVKETLVSGSWNNDKMEDVLQNGVKETFNFDEKHALSYEQGVKKLVEDVIQNGVKETKTPGKDGDILSTIEWMKENNSTSYTKMIDDVIENGVKETLNTEYMPQAMVEDTIQNGTKNPSV
jgi:predicted peroxiredoxin